LTVPTFWHRIFISSTARQKFRAGRCTFTPHCNILGPGRRASTGAISADEDINHIFTNAVQALPVTADEAWKGTAQDRLLQQVNSCLREAWLTKNHKSQVSLFLQSSECTFNSRRMSSNSRSSGHPRTPAVKRSSTVTQSTSWNRTHEGHSPQLCLLAWNRSGYRKYCAALHQMLYSR
uniref:Pecanex-like protein n=1 Tax=Haemonchus placei TaxID=6290 RepID=A0A0N4W4M7_HAEPC